MIKFPPPKVALTEWMGLKTDLKKSTSHPNVLVLTDSCSSTGESIYDDEGLMAGFHDEVSQKIVDLVAPSQRLLAMRIGRPLDMSKEEKQGSVSMPQLNMCNDMTVYANMHSDVCRSLCNEFTLAKEENRNDNMFFLDVRTKTGMSSDCAIKTQIDTSEDFVKKFDHYVTMTSVAPSFSYALGGVICDVDSKYDVQMPTPSDITVLSPPNAGTMNMTLFLIDVTSSRMESAYDKIKHLESEAYTKFSSLDVTVVCMLIRFDTGFWRKDGRIPSPSLGIPRNLLTERDENMRFVAEMITSSPANSVSGLCNALHEKLDPVVEEYMLKLVDMSSSPRPVENEIREVINAMVASDILEESECLEMLLPMVEAHDKNIFAILGLIEAKARSMDMKVAEQLASSWRKGIEHADDRCDIHRAPPIAMNMSNKISSQSSELAKYDFIFKAVQDCLQAEGDMIKRYRDGVAILVNGSMRAIMMSDHVDFSHAQSGSTYFAHNVVGYIKRPCRTKKMTVMVHNGKTVELLPMERKDYEMNPANIPKGATILRTSALEDAPFVQILVNTEFYKDPSFLRFVRRNDTNPPKAKKHVSDEISHATAKELMSRYEAMIDDLVMDKGELNYNKKAAGTFIGKMDLIFSSRSPPQVASGFSSSREMVENRYTDLIDAESTIARALASTLHSHLQPNTVTLLNSSTHAIMAIAFINSPAEHFRSCAVKTLSMSDIRQTAEFDHTPMYYFEDNKWTTAEMVLLDGPVNDHPNQIHVSASYLDTWDLSHVEWMIEKPGKVAVKGASHVYTRPSLSMGVAGWRGWDRIAESDGVEFMKREIVANYTGFMSNRQQATIVMQAQRYLHQSLGGLETDYLATITKLKGVRLRTLSESVPTLKMLAVYVGGVILKLTSKKEVLRAANTETFTLMPHLLRASADPAINTSAYFAYLQYNSEKQWRTAYEALDVLSVWKQMDAYTDARMKEPELLEGFSTESMELLSSMRNTRGGPADKIEDLTFCILHGDIDVTSLVRKIGDRRVKDEKTMAFQGCNWFELMCYLDVRLEVGTLGSASELIGKDLTEFFTMRGSIDEEKFEPMKSVRSYRKASAMINVVARVIGTGDKTNWPSALAMAAETNPMLYVDQYSLVLARAAGRLPAEPLIQLSDKNQPGKAREISTLNVGYGLVCLLGEKMSMRLSAAIPEDIITSNYKIGDIDRTVKGSQYKKNISDGVELVYMNQDKSSFGPNKRSGSLLAMAAALSPDLSTYTLYEDAIVTSQGKKSRYPHGLLKEALRPLDVSARNSSKPKYVPGTMPGWVPFNESTTTGRVLAEISRQYHGTGKYGPALTSWAEIKEGMPGQGIMGVSSSIAHAAVLRYLKKVVARVLGWSLDAIVTSDDSMCTMTIKTESRSLLIASARRIFALMAAFAGLIENEGKFVMTSHKPEMNTIYYQGPEVVPAFWKFMNAATALHTSGNLSEDLLHSVSKGNDAVKEGASFLDGSLVAAANMVMCIDAHRAWPLYMSSASTFVENMAMGMPEDMARRRCVIFFPPEIMGIPSIDPASSIMSPMGTRTATAINSVIDGSLEDKYAQMVAMHSLRMPEKESIGMASDPDSALLGVVDGNWVTSSSLLGPSTTHVATLTWSTLNGIKGSLRRRKGTLRLATEMGPNFIKCRARMVNASEPTSLGTLVNMVLGNLKSPILVGDADSSPLLQLADLGHSRRRRCLYVTPESVLGSVVAKGWVSPSDLFSTMSNGRLMESALVEFEKRLSAMDKDVEVRGTWMEPIYECLKNEARYALDYTRSVMPAQIRKDVESPIYSESVKEAKIKKKSMYRLLNMAPASKSQIDRNFVFAGCLSECLSPVFFSSLPQDLKRLMIGFPPKGNMEMLDAVSAANAMLNRIVSSFPGAFYVIGNTDSSSIDEEGARENWVRHSYSRGTTAALPYLPIRSSYYALSSMSTMGSTSSGVIEAVLSLRITESLSRCMTRASSMSLPKIGSKKLEVNQMSDYDVGEKLPRPLILKLGPLAGTKQAAALAAASNSSVKLSLESWEKLLRASTRLGWLGTNEERYCVRGPFRFETSARGEAKSFFYSTHVSMDETRRNDKAEYLHTVFSFPKVLAGNRAIEDTTIIDLEMVPLLKALRPDDEAPFKNNDTIKRVELTSLTTMRTCMYGTACMMTLSLPRSGIPRIGCFPYSSLELKFTDSIFEGADMSTPSEPDLAVVSRGVDVFVVADMIRKPIPGLRPDNALVTGGALGVKLRETSDESSCLRLSSYLVASISRGGTPAGRLKRGREEAEYPQTSDAVEGEFGDASSDASPEVEVEAVHSHKGRWGDLDESTAKTLAGSKVSLAEVIETMDQQRSISDLVLVNRLSSLSVREVREMATFMGNSGVMCSVMNMGFMVGLVSTLSRNVVATTVSTIRGHGKIFMSTSGWEDLEPVERLSEFRHEKMGEGGTRGLLSKEMWSMAAHLNSIGINAPNPEQNLILLSTSKGDMSEVLASFGIEAPFEGRTDVSAEEILRAAGLEFEEQDDDDLL
jgi:hypothetical protein